MIKLQIIGHLGKNAVENLVGGKSVLNFSVAHNQRFRNIQGVQQERTIWVDCAMWSPNAVGPYLLQGTHVYVEGTPYMEMYNNNAGVPTPSLKLRVTTVQLLSSGSRPAGEEKAETGADPGISEPADELPF